MVSCDSNNFACDGGYLDYAWDYLESNGVVTEKCLPYTSGKGVVPSCPSKCADGSSLEKFKCKANSVRQSRGANQIKSEIAKEGPVEGAFTVYEDFFNYQKGVYHHVSGGVAGGHAIKILGWGIENGEKYWLCANSWGEGWGLLGFFKIREGECGIEDQVFSCTPDLSGH